MTPFNWQLRRSVNFYRPEEWRSPSKSYWKEYVLHWIYIKEKYGLNYPPGEMQALGVMLSGGMKHKSLSRCHQ